MNRPEAIKRPPAIDLAEQADFPLGAAIVSPSSREVRIGDRREALQPRVMQVLVALAQAAGAVVSRDVLIERCWGGRIVGDDAINRCIGQIRQLADRAGSFEIETIPRVGYRLRLGETAADAAAPALGVDTKPVRARTYGILAALAVLLMCGVGTALFLVPRPRPRPPGAWLVDHSEVPIASDLIEAHPAISPDGKMIAYSMGPDIVSRQIYLQRLSGGEPLRLTNDKFDDVSPSWSPDGSQIVYVAYQNHALCRLMAVPVPSGTARELARCHGDERSEAKLSVSGKDIFFIDSLVVGAIDRVMRLNIESGKRSVVSRPPNLGDSAGDTNISLSPDGRWLSFKRADDTQVSQRMLLDLTSLKERVLIDHDAADTGAAFTDDSRDLLVDTNRGSEFALWAYPIDGGAPTRLLSSPARMERIATGPHGLAAIEISTANANLAYAPRGAGQTPRYLARHNGLDFSPTVGPDGTIAFVSQLPGGDGLWLMRPGSPAHKIVDLSPEDIAYWAEPRWSPDGSRLALVATRHGIPVIRVVTVSGEDVATITLHGPSLHSPVWSDVGKALLFPARDKAKKWQLWRVDLDQADRPVPLPYFGWFYLKAHKEELYGMRDDAPGIWRVNGTLRQIEKTPHQWTIAGDAIAYVDNPFSKDAEILAQPLAGGPPHVLAHAPNISLSANLDVDRAGNIIYSAVTESNRDIEVLHLSRH